MNPNKHIESEVEATLALLDTQPRLNAPLGFGKQALEAWKADELRGRTWRKAMLGKAAVLVGFIGLNGYTWFNTETATTATSQTQDPVLELIDEYQLNWETLNLYE